MARTTVADQLAKLRKEREALEKREKALVSRTRGKALAQIADIVRKNGLTSADIAEVFSGAKRAAKPRKAPGAAGKRAKVAPKYRNPANAAETWTGRGRMPAWVRALSEAGKLDSARIADASA